MDFPIELLGILFIVALIAGWVDTLAGLARVVAVRYSAHPGFGDQ